MSMHAPAHLDREYLPPGYCVCQGEATASETNLLADRKHLHLLALLDVVPAARSQVLSQAVPVQRRADIPAEASAVSHARFRIACRILEGLQMLMGVPCRFHTMSEPRARRARYL